MMRSTTRATTNAKLTTPATAGKTPKLGDVDVPISGGDERQGDDSGDGRDNHHDGDEAGGNHRALARFPWRGRGQEPKV